MGVTNVQELAYRDGRLWWLGNDVQAITRGLNTPFFLFSEARMAGNVDSIREGFRDAGLEPTIRYCAKTNGELAVLQVVRRSGANALVAHVDEGEIALRAGFSPQSLAFQKPVLTDGDVRWLVSKKIGMAHVASLSDVERLECAAAKARTVVAVSIRVRDEQAFLLHPLGFYSRRLGIASQEATALARRIASSEWLELRALNCYIGTQQRGTAKFAKAIDALYGIAESLRREGVRVSELNLGGGIPSPGTLKPKRNSSGLGGSDEALRTFVRSLGTIFVEAKRRHDVPGLARVAVEPGRAIVGDAALLVARVDAVAGRWIHLDASRNFLGESPLVIRRRILPLVPRRAGRQRLRSLSGGTLNTLDVIAPFRNMRPVQAGDLLAIADAGAYTLGRAMRYAGLTPAVHLLRSSGRVVPIRDAETFEDVLRPMRTIADDDA